MVWNPPVSQLANNFLRTWLKEREREREREREERFDLLKLFLIDMKQHSNAAVRALWQEYL